MFEDEPPFGWKYLLRKQEAFEKGREDKKFGLPPSIVISPIFTPDYNQGYESTSKNADTLRREEESRRQLGITADTDKPRKSWL